MKEFTPRLWQLFRFISNLERMNVFRAVCLAPEAIGMNVSTVTRMVHLHQPATCTYLKQLASCGLLTSYRNKRYLFYQVQNSPRDDGADIIAHELCKWFVNEALASRYWGPICPSMPFFEILPAFANRLRVVVLKELLSNVKAEAKTISESTLVPEDCCQYHLEILAQHGLAVQDTSLGFRFQEPPTEIERLFIQLSIAAAP